MRVFYSYGLTIAILPRNSTTCLFDSPHCTSKLVSRPSTGPPVTIMPVLRRKAKFIKRCNASTATTPTRNFKRAWVPCAVLELPLSSLSRVSHKNTVCSCSLFKRKFKSERHLFWLLRISSWAQSGHNVPASNAQEASNDVFSLMYFFLEFLSVLFCTSSSSLIVFNCCTLCHDSSATSWVFWRFLNRELQSLQMLQVLWTTRTNMQVPASAGMLPGMLPYQKIKNGLF